MSGLIKVCVKGYRFVKLLSEKKTSKQEEKFEVCFRGMNKIKLCLLTVEQINC